MTTKKRKRIDPAKLPYGSNAQKFNDLLEIGFETMAYELPMSLEDYGGAKFLGPDDQIGFGLTQLSLKWSKNYPFEIALDSTKDNDVLVLPHILDVSCAFTPIHDFIPKKSVTNSSFFAKTGTGRTANFYDDEEAGSIALAKTRAGIT